jgi:hypothetical protein
VSTNQYSVTEFFKLREENAQGVIPGVFFIYDFSPIQALSIIPRNAFQGDNSSHPKLDVLSLSPLTWFHMLICFQRYQWK